MHSVKRYPEDKKLASEMPQFEELYQKASSAWFIKSEGAQLMFFPATETDYRMHPQYPPLTKEEYEKMHQEKVRQSLDFLKQYSEKEQAGILYYAAQQAVENSKITPMQGIPDTASNREAWERQYKSWAKNHEQMQKAGKHLLSFY